MRRTTRRRALAGAVGLAAAALAGCGGGDGGDEKDLEEETYGDWFEGAQGYDGTEDRTGEPAVRVAVGAGNGLAFGPAAVRVSAGTRVVWEWTGRGGNHNVREEDGAFESEFSGSEGHEFERAFEESGVFRYACEPHSPQGMVGAVDVVDE